jgi:DNA-binding NarL/FixJ family response regulator
MQHKWLAPSQSPKITVMLIAINPPLIHAIGSFFEHCEDMNLIAEVSKSEQAIVQADRLMPAVILVDLDIPGHMGLKTISCLHRAQFDTPIIALSQLVFRSYCKLILASGANEVIDKLKITTELEPAIWRVLKQKD